MTSNTTNTLYNVWGSSASDVFAVGSDGTILHYDGSTWVKITSGTEKFSVSQKSLNGIWGYSSSNVYAVGVGTILRYDGGTWKEMTKVVFYQEGPMTLKGPMYIKVGVPVLAVWGSSRSDLFAVGEEGTTWDAVQTKYTSTNIWRCSDWDWGDVEITTKTLCSVWGSSSTDVFAVGKDGTILHYDGSTWEAMTSNTTASLKGVWGSSSSDVFAVGEEGTILHYGK